MSRLAEGNIKKSWTAAKAILSSDIQISEMKIKESERYYQQHSFWV